MQIESAPPPRIPTVCQGSDFDMGVAQGVAARAQIRAARLKLAELEAFRLQQPRWLPYRVYRWLAEQKASRFLAESLKHDYATMNERLAGIAAGARCSLKGLLLFNALEPLLSSVGGCTACPGACSAVAVRGRRSVSGEPMIARNFDYLPLVQPFYLVRESRPARGLRAMEFTTAPLAGAVDGMNEAGLCITYNYGFATDLPKVSAAPISMVISETLRHCQTVNDAADFIIAAPRWGGAIIMLADASGDIASLELSSTRHHLRRPADGEDTLFHTNQFSGRQMWEVQVDEDAIYTNAAPTPLRGRRLHQSSEMRSKRIGQLLNAADVIDVKTLESIMADHGPENQPNDNTPCVHSAYWYTTACSQYFPKERRMRISYSTACNAQFQDLVL